MSTSCAHRDTFLSRRGPGLMYDEYTEWRDVLEPVYKDPCLVCRKTEFTLSGTCLTCKKAREGVELLVKLFLTIGHVWWSGMDDSAKRFAMMELT